MPNQKTPRTIKRASTTPATPLTDLLPIRITVLMHRAVTRAADLANSESKKFGFNIKGIRVLVALLDRGAMRVSDLIDVIALDPSTLSHLLRRLEKDGYLKRARIEDDNRSVKVALTAKGSTVAEKCRTISLHIEKVLLQDFAEAETEILRKQLHRICANAERELPAPKRTRVVP